MYKWFLLIYKVCCGLGVGGYVIVIVTMMGFNVLFAVKANVWMDSGLLLVFYGLYYGVLGRDIAEVCADKMASHIGVRGGSLSLYHKYEYKTTHKYEYKTVSSKPYL